MGIVTTRCFFLVLIGIPLVACAPQHRAPAAPQPQAGTITFRNSGRDRIQVYLIGERENWLLGRLDPLETARLRLPAGSFAVTAEAVVLAVLPGWSRSLEPRADRRATMSIAERGTELAGEEWLFVNGQLQGPRRR